MAQERQTAGGRPVARPLRDFVTAYADPAYSRSHRITVGEYDARLLELADEIDRAHEEGMPRRGDGVDGGRIADALRKLVTDYSSPTYNPTHHMTFREYEARLLELADEIDREHDIRKAHETRGKK